MFFFRKILINFWEFHFLFVCLNLFLTYATRNDSNQNYFVNPTTNYGFCSGIWSTSPQYCPINTWVTGFFLQQTISSSTTSIFLQCNDQYNTNPVIIPSSSTPHTISIYCDQSNGANFAVGSFVKESCSNLLFLYGMNDFNMRCSYNEIISSSNIPSVSQGWTLESYCKAGSAVCGYQTYENFGFTTYSIIDINLQCCKICDEKNGFYFNILTSTCDFCNLNCYQCYGTSINCTSCPNGLYLDTSSNTCIDNEYLNKNPLFSDFIDQFIIYSYYWNSSLVTSGITNLTCSPSFFLDGSNILGWNSNMNKYISIPKSHYKIRIQFHLYCFQLWNTNDIISVYLDNSLIIHGNYYSNRTMFYGQNCGGKILNSVQKFDISIPHFNDFLILSLNITSSTASWAINHFTISSYDCNLICLTCNQSISNCTRCYYGAFLKSTGVDTSTCEFNCSVLQYLNPINDLCSTSCTSGYFANPLTQACDKTCPSGMYGDNNTNRCLFCDLLCSECHVISTNCTACWLIWWPDDQTPAPACSFKPYVLTIQNNNFLSDSQWNINGNISIAHQRFSCNDSAITSGSYIRIQNGQSLQKTFSITSPYAFIYITFFLLRIGDWSNALLNLYINNDPNAIYGFPWISELLNITTNCEIDYPVLYAYRFYFIYYSTSTPSNLEVTIVSSNSTVAWGIYHLNISVGLCDSSCKNCSSPGNSSLCTSCNSGYYLQSPLGVPSPCVLTCLSNTYPNSFLNQCKYSAYCDLTCSTCIDPSINGCTSCPPGTFLLLPLGISSNSTCNSTCSSGYYGDPSDNQCKICDSNCKTCNQSGSNFCTSCNSGVFLQNPIGPTSCGTQCPNGLYKNITNHTCLLCNSLCETCQGPSSSDCITCYSPHYLVYSSAAASSCQSTCLQKYYGDDSDRKCKNCDSTCLTCDIAGSLGCTSCASTLYLQSSVGPSNCLPNCPSYTYIYQNNQTCLLCDSTCETCSGPQNYQCLSCKLGSYLYVNQDNFSCISSCPIGMFTSESLRLCYLCDSSCKNCSGPNSDECTICSSEIKVLNDGVCIDNCPDGKIVNFNNFNICESCGSNCMKCLTLKTCESCIEGYYVNPLNQCSLKTGISFYIIETNNPVNFEIIFSNFWQYIKGNIKDILMIELESNTSNLNISSILIVNSTLQNNGFLISLKYNIDFLDKINYLNFNLSCNEMNANHYFINNSQKILLNRFSICSNDEYYNSTTNQILQKTHLSPVLEYTNSNLQFLLKFSSMTYIIKNNIPSYSQISIQGMGNSDFSYTINNTTDISEFFINIFPNKSIVGGPILTYAIIVPLDVLEIEKIIISNTTNIKMFDCYLLSASQQQAIESSKSQTKVTSYIASSTVYANSAAGSGTPILLQGMMLTELIYLIKFIDINYPPNVLEIYKSETQMISLFSFYSIETQAVDQEKLPKKFIYYEVNPYFLINCGDIIFKNLFILSIVLLLTIIVENFSQKNLFIKIIMKIHSIIVWELVLFFMLLYMQKFVFYTFSNIMFHSLQSEDGKLNLIISSVFLFLEAFFLFHLFLIFRILKSIKCNSNHLVNSSEENKYFINPQNFSQPKTFDENRKETPTVRLELLEDVISKKDSFISDTSLKSAAPCPKLFGNTNLAIETTSPSPMLYAKNNVTSTKIFDKKHIELQNDKNPMNNNFNNIKILKSENRGYSKIITLCQKTKKMFLSSYFINYLYFPRNHEIFLKQYEFMHEDVRSEGIVQIYYVWFDYVRQITLSILTVIFYFAPLIQILLINLINCCFIFYYIIAYPYKSKILFFFSLGAELITQSALFSALLLAILDVNEESNPEMRFNLGWVIVGANLSLLYWLCLAGIAKFCLIIYEKRQKSKIINFDKRVKK